jgi:hypothetical protein
MQDVGHHSVHSLQMLALKITHKKKILDFVEGFPTFLYVHSF